MTTAGKIALLANLALSVVFAFWGMNLYANRIDWSQAGGEYAQREETIKNYRDNVLPRATARYLAAVPAVNDIEARRPQLQDWEAKQIQNLRAGNDPVQGLVVKRGELATDAQGRPVLGPPPVRGLASIAVLDQEYARLQDQVAKTTQDIIRLVDEERKLTEQIGDGREKGLRADLAAEQLKEKKAQDEAEFLRPLLYNRQVEYALLVKRQQALEARIKELQGASQASQP
jgi:hypothetical protein